MFNTLILCMLMCMSSMYGADKEKVAHVGGAKEAACGRVSEQMDALPDTVEKELQLLALTRAKKTQDQLDKVRELLEQGVDANMSKTREHNTPFDSLPIGNAALKGNLFLTELLLEYGADPTATFTLGKHRTQALHCLARGRLNPRLVQKEDCKKIVYALVSRGADPSAGASETLPYTPLHILAMQKRMRWVEQEEIALALFACNALECKESYEGEMPIDIARRNHLWLLARLFKKRRDEIANDREVQTVFLEAFYARDLQRAKEAFDRAKEHHSMVVPREPEHIRYIYTEDIACGASSSSSALSTSLP